MPVRKGSKKLGASPSLSNKDTLGDDETRLARWDQMTAAEKARVRAREKAELKEAESERKRPLTTRVVDTLYDKLGRTADAKARAKEAKVDNQYRANRYEEAKREASRSDADRATREGPLGVTRYPVDRPVKLRKGGSVSASRRGDGIARKGKTRGKMV